MVFDDTTTARTGGPFLIGASVTAVDDADDADANAALRFG